MKPKYSPEQISKWLEDVRAMYPKVRIGILEKPLVITAITVTSTVVTEVGTKTVRRDF